MTHRKYLMPLLLVGLVVLAIANLLGAPIITPKALAGLGLASAMPFAMAGETSLKEIQEMLVKHDEAFGEFRRQNEALLKAKAEGKSVADLESKVGELNTELSKLTADLVRLNTENNRSRLDANLSDADAKLTPAQREYKTAFKQFLRGEVPATTLQGLQAKAYNSQSNPDGGFVVIPEMDMEIDRVVSVVSAVARLSDVRTITSDAWKKWIKTVGLTARRVGPGATGGETTNAKFSEIEIPLYESEAEPWIHNATLADAAVNLEADLASEAGIAFAELSGLEFCQGSGVASARGITTQDVVANASYAWGKVGYVFTGQNGAFAASNPGDKMIELQHALKSQYRPGAAWVMPDSVLMPIRQMKDGSGAYYLWQPDPLAGFGGRLLGSPVEVDDNMPALATDSLSVAYGDFKRAYVVVNRSGTELIRDNITQKGVTKFNFRRRFGGGVKNFEAYKVMKFGTS